MDIMDILEIALVHLYRFGFCIGFLTGVVIGYFNRPFQKGRNENQCFFEFLFGLILVLPFIQRVASLVEIPFFEEGAYLTGGAYLLWKSWSSYQPQRIRIVFAIAGWLTLCVPLKLLIDILVIYLLK